MAPAPNSRPCSGWPGARTTTARGVLGGDRPRLRHDGQVEYHGSVWNNGRDGLPAAQVIELLVDHSSGYRGRFLLATTEMSHSTMPQRLAAVALADQVGASLERRVVAR